MELTNFFTNNDNVIRHTDPAMNGLISEKSYINVKPISKDSFMNRIIPGKAYVIVFAEYVIERFVFLGSNGNFLLKSTNPVLYPDFELPKEDINELWLIKSWVKVPEVIPV